MKKSLLIFANCQGEALAYFLRKTRMPEFFDIKVYANYRIILGQESYEKLVEDAARCDVFLYQPTDPLKHGQKSSAEIIEHVVPKAAQKISFSYSFNSGFFPICKYGSWHTGQQLLQECQYGGIDLVEKFDLGILNYDCARRFAECLAEQSRREETMDIRLAQFILQNFQTKHLFTMINHPSSELLVELTRRVIRLVRPELDYAIEFNGANEAKLPGYHAVHPAVVRELGLKYQIPNDEGDMDFYRVLIQELQDKRGQT